MAAPRLSRKVLERRVEAFVRAKGNYSEAARSLGLDAPSLRHSLTRAAEQGIPVPSFTPEPEEYSASSAAQYRVGGSPQDREIIRLRDEVGRLKRELEDVHRSSLDDDEARRILQTAGYAPPDPPKWLLRVPAKRGTRDAEVPVLMLADWHRGEVVSRAETNGVNEYDSAIMEERARRVVDRAINLATEHGPGNYPGIVCNLLGDFVSGGLHIELAKSDDEEPLVSALRCRDILVWALSRLADVFGQVYAPAVCGNHGRMTPKPEFKRYVYKNADWLIYQLLIRHFESVGDDRVKIDVRPSNEVFYRVFNKRFLAQHGDMLGVKGGDGIIGALGPIARGEIKTRGSSASSSMEYDHLLIGHWHQTLWLPRVFVSNTIKGFDEYAKNSLRATPSVPSQSLFFVHPEMGITSRWEVYAEAPRVAGDVPWVSVFDPAEEVA